jgi:phosphatidylglycerol---prolipoprotein diacylglyceryl transferase
MSLMFITWDVHPNLFEIGPITVRWYGLLFASAFLVGHYIMQNILKKENQPKEWMDSLLIYMMVGTVLGARLGHVFFYQWDYYSQNLGEILQVWKGGLASHGAAIGIILSLALWSYKVSKKPLLWILDRIVITVALAAVFIRFGNLMNHEIIGDVTNVPWAFIFTQAGYEVLEPRHPTQLYEAFSYLLIFGLLIYLYYKQKAGEKAGLMFGLFLILLFSARFFIEFVKEVQVEKEIEMTLNMGQQLSIPLVLVGLFFVIKALISKSQTA